MDPFTLIMLAVLALLIFFMFRNSRKRQKDLAALQEQMVPGADVMTSFGLYGTLLSIDAENNTVLVETSPGNTVKLHRQALTRVIDPVVVDETEESTALDATVVDEPDAPASARITDDDVLARDDDTDGSGNRPKRVDE